MKNKFVAGVADKYIGNNILFPIEANFFPATSATKKLCLGDLAEAQL